MSTRASIIVEDSKGQKTQYYHHTDGYPEWMGKCLSSFIESSIFTKSGDGVDKTFETLLKCEGSFEEEDLGDIHTDIEYIWYVKIAFNKVLISYTDINDATIEEIVIEDYDEREDYKANIIYDLLTTKIVGDTKYDII